MFSVLKLKKKTAIAVRVCPAPMMNMRADPMKSDITAIMQIKRREKNRWNIIQILILFD
jgi:hypothetical protein